VLQTVGDELIAAGWEPFCRAVLDRAGYVSGSVVVDGICHEHAATSMRAILPVELFVVSVAAPNDDRRRRLVARGLTDADIDRADQHANESQVLDVVAGADLALDGHSSSREAADAVLAWLRGKP
jgi:hypothetical protein